MTDPGMLISELSDRLRNGDLNEKQKWLEKKYVLSHPYLVLWIITGTDRYRNFAAMDKDDLDRYLDQCQTVLLGNHTSSTDAGLFPLGPPSDTPPAPDRSWTDFHQKAPLMSIIPTPENQGLEAGEKIRSWDSKDVTGELPVEYETVVKAAAEVIGVTPRDVGVIVEVYERKLDKMSRERSRSRSRSMSRAASIGQRRK